MSTERKPTPEQHEIICFLRDEPETNTMVDARAGAAKTSTIEMAAPFIKVDSVLAVAFNKRIAEELSERVPSWWQCRTLNALGHQAWQEARGKRAIIDADKMFKIVKGLVPSGSSETEDLFATTLGLARRAKSIGLVPTGAPMGVKGLIEDHKDEWEDMGFTLGFFDVPDDAIFFARQALLQSIQKAFMSEIDFDDQIYMSVLFGGKYPLFHTVVVDESQDLSPLNHRQLMRLTRTRLVSVGDPYQAIYAFRGADGQSMTSLEDYMHRPKGNELGGIGKGNFKRLGLTQSFRVPKLVSKRQTRHVPDFGSMPFLPDGEIIRWPQPKSRIVDEGELRLKLDDAMAKGEPEKLIGEEFTAKIDHTEAKVWSVKDIPRDGAVLCRNNAPLMKVAFACIKSRIPVKVLGRDIGASLANLLLKITGKESIVPVANCYPKVADWQTAELAKVPDSETKQETIRDRADSLLVLLDACNIPMATNQKCAEFIRELFSDKPDQRALTLSSGHRAKGLEWDWVMHLDPWRIPSKQAKKAAARGDDRPMIQELNLGYVIETRTKHTLVMADTDHCSEIGE